MSLGLPVGTVVCGERGKRDLKNGTEIEKLI